MNAVVMVAVQALFTGALPAALPQASGQKPQALLYAEEKRNQIVSAEVEYSVQARGGTKFKSARLFAGDLLAVNFGDPDGLTNGKPGDLYSHSRIFSWRSSDGHFYQYLDGWVSMRSVHFDRPGGSTGDAVYDFRALGLETRPVVGWTVGQYANVDPDVAQYEVADVGEGIVEVRCIGTSRPDVERVWRLDSIHDYRPVVVQQIVGGEVLEEARSYYDDTDGVGVLPSRVEYSAPDPITTQIDVFSATINEPYHRAITFADFPLFPGVQLYGPNEKKAWDGTSFVSAEEFSERVGKGEIDATELMRAARAASPSTSPPPFSSPEARGGWLAREADPAEPRMWAPYVRSFLIKHRAEKEVRELAWRLHKGCLEAAREYVDRRDSVKEPESEAGRREIVKLEEVMTKVFETRLKPGLEKLVK
jgi:hypothetical protein